MSSKSSSKTQTDSASVSKLKDDLSQIVREASALLSDVSTSASEAAQEGAARTRQTYDQGLAGLRDGYGAACDTAVDLTETAGHEIRKRPFTALGLTLGAGLIIGSLLTLGSRRS